MAKAFLVGKAFLFAAIAAVVVAEIFSVLDPLLRGFLSGCAFAGVIAYFNNRYEAHDEKA
jgi:hypothetical protein